MKLSLLGLLGALTLGCATKPCRQNTVFLTIDYGAAGQAADTIQVALAFDGETPQLTTLSHLPGVRSGSIEVTFPSGYQSGRTLSIMVTALQGGNEIASADSSLSLAPTCTALSIALQGAVNEGSDLSPTPPDMAPAEDMASAGSDMTSGCPAGQNCVYVSSTGPSCPGGVGSGTAADPYCRMQTGFDQGNGKTIVVLPGSYTEGISLNQSTTYVTTVLASTATLQYPSATAIQLTNANNATVSVTIDGLKIVNSDTGVGCVTTSTQGSLKVVLRGVQIAGNRLGINGTNCDLTLDSTFVGPNSGGGVGLNNTDFTIVNTVIAKNGTGGSGGSPFGGLQHLGNFNRAQLINSTIADNAMDPGKAPAAGVSCGANGIGSAVYVIFNDVIFGNTGGPTGEFNAAGCPPDHTAYVGGTGTNPDLTSCSAAQLFANAGTNDFHPVNTAAAPCTLVNDGTASFMTVSAPAVDFGGVARPQGGAFDIGAYEFH